MTTTSFSALSPAAQWQAVIQLRCDMVRRLGRSAASLSWWHRAILAADPVVEWSADQHTAVVHQGQVLLDFMARCYLVTPRASAVRPDAVDEELLALLP
ncbi:hypothetical protein [Hymenobacter siberiensis]|uniref:hypothetical protein n=1 Tax=Hymenobacter siberiensis TaxID=2848396 RepID=UPI001C1E1648|nr:hypothetical protein [Hymenobacter siberiensis]MBU6120415.1 hypothetical protein [Hymenobacter siberiensis]